MEDLSNGAMNYPCRGKMIQFPVRLAAFFRRVVVELNLSAEQGDR